MLLLRIFGLEPGLGIDNRIGVEPGGRKGTDLPGGKPEKRVEATGS